MQEISPIAHWTVLPERAARGEQLCLPPFIAWRYQQPSEGVADFLRWTISTFQGVLAWQFLTTGRRWTLMPTRLREYAELHGCPGVLIAAAKLKVTEPNFGKCANAELFLLAEHIQRNLDKATREIA